jgi:hypothetical protein
MFKFRILMNIFGPKKDEEIFRILPVEACDLFRSLNVCRILKGRKSQWAGHVFWMEESRNEYF